MTLGRRRFATLGLVGGLAVIAGARTTPALGEALQPENSVGRVFVREGQEAGIATITATVWRYSSADKAGTARVVLANQATATDLADGISIVEVEEFPISSLPGSLVSWIEVVGDGAVETPFAGGYFHQGVLVWSIVTTGDDRDAMFALITELGRDLLSRGVPATPEVEHPFVGGLWDLLPAEGDLPDGFRLYQVIEQGNVYTPEGTPVPDFESAG